MHLAIVGAGKGSSSTTFSCINPSCLPPSSSQHTVSLPPSLFTTCVLAVCSTIVFCVRFHLLCLGNFLAVSEFSETVGGCASFSSGMAMCCLPPHVTHYTPFTLQNFATCLGPKQTKLLPNCFSPSLYAATLWSGHFSDLCSDATWFLKCHVTRGI